MEWQEGLRAAEQVDKAITAILGFLKPLMVLQEGLGALAVEARQALVPLAAQQAGLVRTIAELQSEIARHQEALRSQRAQTTREGEQLRQQLATLKAEYAAGVETARQEKQAAMQALDGTWAQVKATHTQRVQALDQAMTAKEALHREQLAALAAEEAAAVARVKDAEQRLREIGVVVQRLGTTETTG